MNSFFYLFFGSFHKQSTNITIYLYQANEDITQMVEILPSGPEKWSWMSRRLVEFTSTGSVLVFVTKKANAEELASNLRLEDHSLGLLHGDMDQSERNKVITDFKKKAIPVLVATDVAGEDLKDRLKNAEHTSSLYLTYFLDSSVKKCA